MYEYTKVENDCDLVSGRWVMQNDRKCNGKQLGENHREAWEEQGENFIYIKLRKQQLSMEPSVMPGSSWAVHRCREEGTEGQSQK